MTGYILSTYEVGAWLNSNAIVTALVPEILQACITYIHGVESIGILDPILAIRSLCCCCIRFHVYERQICSVHDVNSPQLRVFDVEVLNTHIGHIPEYEGHRSAFACLSRFISIPEVTIAVDIGPSGSVYFLLVTIYADVVAGEDEAGTMVLEGYEVGVLAPVIQVIRELKLVISVTFS